MIAGQTMRGSNGKQNFLFPMEEMYITQGSYEYTYSHNGCYAMDFVGWNGSSQVTHYPYYAPFDCTLVAKWGTSDNYQCVWQSNDEVNFVDGTTGYACIAFNHDPNNQFFVVGATRNQGEAIGTTGTYGATADHLHIEAKKGVYNGYHQNSEDVYMLTDSTWLYDLMGVNDTTIYKGYYVNSNNVRVDYPWETFPDTPQPHPAYVKKGKFPWVLYARKLRNKM